MKRLLMTTILCCFFSVPAFSQANQPRRFEINWNLISYNRIGSADFAGGTLGLAVRATEHVSIVAEVAVHSEFNFFDNQNLTTYTFGPRYSVKRGNRLTLFTEARAGGAHVTSTAIFGSGSPTSGVNGFAFGGGGGVDLGIRPWVAWRAVQGDYTFARIGETNKSGFRIGTGFVFRFGE